MNELRGLTPRAHQTIALAQKIARERGHESIGSLHLLYGVARLNDLCVAAKVLANHFSVPVKKLQEAIEGLLEIKPAHNHAASFSPDADKVFEVAFQEKRSFGYHFLGTEMILLGIVGSDCSANLLLRSAGLDLQQVRERILRELDPTYRPADRVVEALLK